MILIKLQLYFNSIPHWFSYLLWSKLVLPHHLWVIGQTFLSNRQTLSYKVNCLQFIVKFTSNFMKWRSYQWTYELGVHTSILRCGPSVPQERVVPTVRSLGPTGTGSSRFYGAVPRSHRNG